MRSSVLKGVVVALVAAAVLVPAASAKSHQPAVKLARVPLPKARLGSAAGSLHISLGSGRRSYEGEPKKLGRVTGYQLIYGSLFLGNPGLDEVATSVDVYKTARDAKHALPYWKKDDLESLANFTQLNLTVTEASLAVPAIGDSHWAGLWTFSVPNYGSVYFAYVEICDGKYVLDLGVAAGSQDLAMSYAAAKARRLDKRLHLGVNGRLHRHHVALPKRPHPGPPADGPDPKAAALQTGDLPGSEINGGAYTDSYYGALSTYERDFEPAGSFDDVGQIVSVMPTTNSAGFFAAYFGAEVIASSLGRHESDSPQVTPVDVSAVGDEAQAAIVSSTGSTANFVVVTLHSGAVADFVFAESSTTIDPSAVQTLAQAAATRLDAALP